MKLYRTGTGRWEGTQIDASRAARNELTNWAAVEVPTDKPSLLAWLNQHCGGGDSVVADTPAPVTPVEARPVVTQKIEELQAGFARNIAVEDQIAAADLPAAIRIASHALCRVQEHLNAAKAEGGES